MLTRHSTELTDPGVVPSLADKWSHHTGGTHLKVVPCHWRATCPGRCGAPTGRHARSIRRVGCYAHAVAVVIISFSKLCLVP
jgi:hypothetical protein